MSSDKDKKPPSTRQLLPHLDRQGSASAAAAGTGAGGGGGLGGSSSGQSPTLSVCALAVHDDSQVWPFVERYFRAQLPLRDVAWRMPTANNGSTLVTISTLPIQVLEAGHALFRNLDAGKSGYRAPYAHLYLVVCESAEAYKGSVRARVRAWVDERAERGEEWLLLYVPVGTQNNTRETYAKLYGKLAGDFCLKTPGDRSAMLSILEGGVQSSLTGGGGGVPVPLPDLPAQSHQEQWGDVLGKVKAAVGNSFVARSRRYQDEVRRLEEQAQQQAATADDSSALFFRLFFAKEALALMHEQLQLPSDALAHYQELSALAARWQHMLPTPSAPPKSLMVFQRSRVGIPVLEFPVFEFRVKLEGGTDSVGLLEVQQYLFAREAGFLLQLGRYPDLFRRTQAFVLQHHEALARLLSPASGQAAECAQLWSLSAAWTVLRSWESFMRQQQQQQQQAATSGSSTSTTNAASPSPPTSLPQQPSASPPPPPPPVLGKAASSSVLGGGKVILLDQATMARHLAELLEFARLRFLDLANTRLGADRLACESAVCAARRGEPATTPTPPAIEGGGAGGGATKRAGPPCTTLEEVEAAALSSSSSSSSSSLDGSSGGGGGGGGRGASLSRAASLMEDPRLVPLVPSALEASLPWLQGVLASGRALDEHCLRVTEVLARYLEQAGRERCLGRVEAERASVLLRLGEVEEARRVFRALADGCYRRDFWVPLLSRVLQQLATCEQARGSVRACVSALLQVLSLQEALDDGTSAHYLEQLGECVRHPTLVAGGGPRLVKPLGLVVMARIKAAPRELETTPRVELGQPASVTVWLNLALRQPLTIDGLTLVLGEAVQQRRLKRLGPDLGWLTPPAADGGVSPRSPRAGSSPRSPRSSSQRSPRKRSEDTTATAPATVRGRAEGGGEKEYLQWHLGGPLVLQPGVNELDIATRALPPPGAYVYERLLLQVGGLLLEQDQVAALDTDTLDLVTKHRPPPRRFSALAKAPIRRAVALTVVARPPASSLALLASPVLPPDPQHVYRLSLLLETRSDTLTHPTLTLVQAPQPALALEGPATLAFYPDEGGEEQGADDGRSSPLAEQQAEVTWDGGATASVQLPAEIGPHTSLLITLPTRPLPRVAEAFARGRQDHQQAVAVKATLSAEFNKDLLATSTSASAGACSVAVEEGEEEEEVEEKEDGADEQQRRRKKQLVPTTGHWSHEALDESLRRTELAAAADAVILQPFSVSISVQGCSHWRASRRYFVQALLRSRAPLPVTLHDCRLRLPASYRIVADNQAGSSSEGDESGGGSGSGGGVAHLRDVPLQPGQEVRYTYLIERLPSSASSSSSDSGRASTPTGRELPSKMSVSAAYTWEPLQAMRGPRVARYHPPPQQQSFERYFQDSAMLNRGDALRTFVVRAQLVPATDAAGSSDSSAAAAVDAGGGGGGRGLLPASAPATPGDVEERGVVVGYFQNRVAEGLVGVALRMEVEVRLSEEACRERDGSREGEGDRRPLRLHFEVAADPGDWAVAGVCKGTLEVPYPVQDLSSSSPVAKVTCKLVPVRTGLLACPAVLFEPVDARPAVSPKSRRKSNVRWVGPRDIQILAGGGLTRIPTVRIV